MIHVVRLSRILVVDGCRVLIGIDGISGEIKYDPGLSEVAVLEWYLFVVFRAEIVMTEDEIGDVGNRGVNHQRITFLLKVVID